MDFKLAIEHNRAPLLVEILKLFAMIGLAEGVTVERISRPLHREVLKILRTAESAVRRLIVTAARDIVVEYTPRPPAGPKKPKTSSGDKPKAKPKADGEAKPRRKRRPLFNLFDALRRVGRFFRKKKRRFEPRIRVLGDPPDTRHRMYTDLGTRPEPPPAPPPPVVEEKAPIDDGMVSTANLIRRLLAVLDAVQDIQGHAMRLAHWEARPKEERRPDRWSPLRSGRPPGFRQRAKYAVDDILKECHWLARLGNPPVDDTS